jgi:hypothetical protein
MKDLGKWITVHKFFNYLTKRVLHHLQFQNKYIFIAEIKHVQAYLIALCKYQKLSVI